MDLRANRTHQLQILESQFTEISEKLESSLRLEINENDEIVDLNRQAKAFWAYYKEFEHVSKDYIHRLRKDGRTMDANTVRANRTRLINLVETKRDQYNVLLDAMELDTLSDLNRSIMSTRSTPVQLDDPELSVYEEIPSTPPPLPAKSPENSTIGLAGLFSDQAGEMTIPFSTSTGVQEREHIMSRPGHSTIGGVVPLDPLLGIKTGSVSYGDRGLFPLGSGKAAPHLTSDLTNQRSGLGNSAAPTDLGYVRSDQKRTVHFSYSGTGPQVYSEIDPIRNNPRSSEPFYEGTTTSAFKPISNPGRTPYSLAGAPHHVGSLLEPHSASGSVTLPSNNNNNNIPSFLNSSRTTTGGYQTRPGIPQGIPPKDQFPFLEPNFVRPSLNNQMGYHQSSPEFMALSSHILEKDILKGGIEIYTGVAHRFWPWISKVDEYLNHFPMNPGKALQMLESFCGGEPLRLIQNHTASCGAISQRDVDEVWESLRNKFGHPHKISSELTKLVEEYPCIKGKDIPDQLDGLVNLCKIILYNQDRCPDLASYDHSKGIHDIRCKLPDFIQKEWGVHGPRYEASHGHHPPFSEFVRFLKGQSTRLSSCSYEIVHPASSNPAKKTARVLTTVIESPESPRRNGYGSYKENPTKTMRRSFQENKENYHPSSPRKPPPYKFQPAEEKFCIFCPKQGHKIHNCYEFRDLNLEQQQEFMKKNNLCFRCLGKHRVESCKVDVVCFKCHEGHATAFHFSKFYPKLNSGNKPKTDSRKKEESDSSSSKRKEEMRVMCTRTRETPNNINCSKTLLVEIFMDGVPEKKMTAYAIIDEQSDTTLVDDRVVEYFGKDFPTQEYKMKVATQGYEFDQSGKLVSGLKIRGKLEDEIISLPEVLSNPLIADTTSEVASPEMVRKNESTYKYAQFFPERDPEAPVLLLIGRDCGRAMATECLTLTEPFVHKTALGYSLVGRIEPQSSLEENNEPRVLKTTILRDLPVEITYKFPKKGVTDFEIFRTSPDDDQLGLSQDDKKFMDIVQPNIKVTPKGNIEVPLPTKDIVLPKNDGPVYFRTKKTLSKLLREPDTLEECIQSMQKSIDNHYVEEIPTAEVNTPSNPTWYLPIFCVEQKKKAPRLVYDASAKYGGVSLNDALYQGPDLNNQLRNVLLRFRERPIAFAADIQSMFNNFAVPEDQKDLLRFLWFRNNDPEQEIVPFRSTCHIFGCVSSPAVCTIGLKYCAGQLPAQDEAREYLEKNFYVDDGLFSTDSPTSAIEILSKTTSLLKSYGMKLHKIVSNSPTVLEKFPDALRSVSPTTLPSENPSCSALGAQWDTEDDKFILIPDLPSKPFTKRGILSVINSLFDPLGLVSPVLLQGRLMQRQILSNKSDLGKYDWDDKLPQSYFKDWSDWLSSLDRLAELAIPRSFYPDGFIPIRQELHIFSDASQKAIGHVAYIRSINKECESHVSFVTASSRLAPKAAPTIPRLELNAAVEACKTGFKINSELRHKPDAIYFHTDSQIVLGYLKNKQRRFSKYIERRISVINNLFPDSNWSYVGTKDNPADQASRPCSPQEIFSSNWLKGPPFLWDPSYIPEDSSSSYKPSASLPEEVLEVCTQVTQVDSISTFSNLFKKISSLTKLTNIMKIVLRFVRRVDRIREREDPTATKRPAEVTNEEAQSALIKLAQSECLGGELTLLKSSKPLPDSNKLSNLSPILDKDGIMRVGGRLKNADIAFSAKHPVLIPENHPLSTVMIEHHHKMNKHQGSLITHNSIIQNGFHIQNGRRLIRKLLNTCVTCRKLRAKTSTQMMADLPPERLSDLPPFTHVGIDVFGPFYIFDGKSTRSTKATKKIWALIIVCLPSRAIHLEYLPGMDTSSFRNAFQRFQSVRGPCKTIRSDQGSNFMLAKKQMEALDISSISDEFRAQGIKWTLNSPHASHQGGAWERKIGSVRRVLEATFELISHRGISRDEFITFLAEAASVVNNTPLWTPSFDPNDPTPLTPQMLLTLRKPNDSVVLEDFSEEDILAYGRQRYRRSLYLASQFWQRWRTEYLRTLNTRQKWRKPSPSYKIGDVVLIKEKNLARNSWPLGRVSETKPSSDGLVRKVILTLPPLPGRTSTRSVERAVTDLVLLLPNETMPSSDSV